MLSAMSVVAMTSALNLEPYIVKKGAVGVHVNHDGGKRFEEFIMSSSMMAGAMMHTSCYRALRDVMIDSVLTLGKTRMWGAYEVLMPWAYARYKGISFLDFIKGEGILSVRNLMDAREVVWNTSKDPVKIRYLRDFSFADEPAEDRLSVWHHYRKLRRWGHEQESRMVWTWCDEIIKGLPTARMMIGDTMGMDLQETMSAISTRLWDFYLEERGLSVGQLADYVVIVLYERIMERFRQ